MFNKRNASLALATALVAIFTIAATAFAQTPTVLAQWIAPDTGTYWQWQEGNERPVNTQVSAMPTSAADTAALLGGNALPEEFGSLIEVDGKGVRTTAWVLSASQRRTISVPVGFAEIEGRRYGVGSVLCTQSATYRFFTTRQFNFPSRVDAPCPESDPAMETPDQAAPSPPTAESAPAPQAVQQPCLTFADLSRLGDIRQRLGGDGAVVTFNSSWEPGSAAVLHREGQTVSSVQPGQTATVWVEDRCRPVQEGTDPQPQSAHVSESSQASAAQSASAPAPAAQVVLPPCPSDKLDIAKGLLDWETKFGNNFEKAKPSLLQDQELHRVAGALTRITDEKTGKLTANGWKLQLPEENALPLMAHDLWVIDAHGVQYAQPGVWTSKPVSAATIWRQKCQ